jgi:hypothetical protein
MCLVGLGVGAGDVVRAAGETVGRGGTGVSAVSGCGGFGAGAGAAICGMGVGLVVPEAGGVGTGAGPCAGLIGGIGPPELGTGTGPCAGPIWGIGPPELGTGAERFALSTVAAGVDCGAAAPPTFVSARTELGTTAKAIPNTIVTAERSAVLRWAVRLKGAISATGGRCRSAATQTYVTCRVDTRAATRFPKRDDKCCASARPLTMPRHD